MLLRFVFVGYCCGLTGLFWNLCFDSWGGFGVLRICFFGVSY